MRNVPRFIGAMIFVMAAGLGAWGAAAPAPPIPCAACCYHPQSPRRLTAADWNWTSSTPAVRRQGNSIVFTPHPGVQVVLNRCSQHYHCALENDQACPGRKAAPASSGALCPWPQPIGSWVEIHTAYHDGPACVPTPQHLDCCRTDGPLVVVAHQAKVTSRPLAPPLAVQFGPPAAEWSGSSTSPPPPECKTAAYWSFTLGCGFEVSQQQLQPFNHPEEARALQPPDRLSRDLTHIVRP
jgi:hypothetical protein